MKSIFRLAFLLVLIPSTVWGQYKFTEIQRELLEGANAVVRLSEGEFKVTSISSGVFRNKRIVTILNAKAKSLAELVVGYDKLRSVKIIKGSAYDGFGKEIYKFRKSDIVDQSSINGFSVYEDNRLKYLDLKQPNYPYTIEYEYEVDYDFLYSIPNWVLIPGASIAVEKSMFTLSSPKDLQPRFRNFNIEDNNFTDLSTSAEAKYKWEFENLKGIELEPFGPEWNEITPVVMTAPSKFEFEGYQGSWSSWDEVGQWQQLLNKGRDNLPQATIDKIKGLTAGMSDDRSKIKAVYEYLQGQTRYVSIQLGIGGFQPFPAIDVDKLGYGDCKALTFYTQSLLKAIGIEALYTLVEADDDPRPLLPDFPNSTFNHVILCVPNKGDTVWLECTSQNNPFGYMGEFTGDRDVLAITNDGAKIVHTPIYDEKVNVLSRNIEIQLDAAGNAKAHVENKFAGLMYEHQNLNWALSYGEKDTKEWILNNTDFANFQLVDYTTAVDKSPIPSATITANYEVPKYAKLSGKRLSFNLNALSRQKYNLPKVDDRKTDFIWPEAVTEVDSVTFNFPGQFNFEYMPSNTEITSKYGEYTSSITKEEGKVIYTRKFVVWKKRYAPEDYAEFISFLNKVIRADDAKVVLNGTT
uniref:DUF3857 domain-containing protein n=2 Tax=Roseivirga sp. TaxID=1964215 RepID=UPI004047B5EA